MIPKNPLAPSLLTAICSPKKTSVLMIYRFFLAIASFWKFSQSVTRQECGIRSLSDDSPLYLWENVVTRWYDSSQGYTRAANIVVPELMSSLTALEPPQPLRATQKGIENWEYLHLRAQAFAGISGKQIFLQN